MKRLALLFALTACSNGAPKQNEAPAVSDATPSQTAIEERHEVPGPAEVANFRLPQAVPPNPVVETAAAAGDTSVKIEGCALDGKGATRGGPMSKHHDDTLSVKADGKTVVVTHFVNHACCQKGVVTTKLSDNTIEINEALEGNACRCMCSSTFTTTQPVNPGRYSVHVTVTTGTNVKDAGTQSVTVE